MNRPLNRPMITVSIMLATIMQTLDSTIANVALRTYKAYCNPPARAALPDEATALTD